MKLVDLTQSFDAETPTWPYFPTPQVRSYHTHSRDAKCSKIVETNMHTSTHVDAPYHFSSRGWDLAEIPMDHLCSTGLVVDISDRISEYDLITRDIIEESVPEGESLRKEDILILYTGWERYCFEGEDPDEETYFCKVPGPDRETVDWCIDMDFKWVGIDCPSFEHGLNTDIRNMRPDLVEEMEEKFGQPLEEILPEDEMLYAHRIFLGENNQLIVENLGGDLSTILGQRATFGAFPWKWNNGEASMCRVVAFLDEDGA